jgi:hypothetical protein
MPPPWPPMCCICLSKIFDYSKYSLTVMISLLLLITSSILMKCSYTKQGQSTYLAREVVWLRGYSALSYGAVLEKLSSNGTKLTSGLANLIPCNFGVLSIATPRWH